MKYSEFGERFPAVQAVQKSILACNCVLEAFPAVQAVQKG